MAVDAGVSGGVATDNTSWNTGLTVSIPASSSGDLLVLFAFRDEDDSGDWSTPSGWTRHTAIDGTETAGRDRVSMVCTKSSSGSEPSTLNVAGTVSNSRQMSACIVNYGSSDGLDVTPTASHRVADTNDDTPPNAAITTATNDAMVVVMTGLAAANTVSAWAAPTGYTLVDSQTGNAAIGIAEKLVSTAGTENPGDWTNTASGNIGEYIGATIAIKPSAGGGATYTLTAEAGSFSISGTDASLLVGRSIEAAAGSYSITGTDAGLLKGYSLNAEAGSYSVTGTDAALSYGRALAAEAGSFSLSGTDASLLHGRYLSAEAGSYSLTGTDATLTYTPVGGYVLTAEPGSFSVSGTDASLLYGRVLSAESGSFAISGTAATLAKGFRLSAEAGSYSLSGTAAQFFINRVLSAEAGSFTITGANVTFTYSGASLWIIQGGASTSWAEQNESSDTWTVQSNSSDNWSVQ